MKWTIQPVKATKEYTCKKCNEPIDTGEQHVVHTWRRENFYIGNRYHILCLMTMLMQPAKGHPRRGRDKDRYKKLMRRNYLMRRIIALPEGDKLDRLKSEWKQLNTELGIDTSMNRRMTQETKERFTEKMR